MRWSVLLALPLLAVLGGCNDAPTADAAGPDATTTRTLRAPVVRVARVEAAPGSRDVRFSASTRPADRALVAFAQPGRVVRRHVDVGAVVAAGDPVALLDEEPIRNQLRAAEAAIADVEAQRAHLARERDRATRLVDARVASTQVVDGMDADNQRLSAAMDVALARRDEARRVLRDTTLRAPVGGVVSQVFVQPGEVVGPGTPVVLILGQQRVEVEIEVPERVLAGVVEGASVRVDLPLSGRHGLVGSVTAVGRATGGPGRLFPVVVSIDDDRVASGMAADVYVSVPMEGAMRVPLAAVVAPAGQSPSVYRTRDGVVEAVAVELRGYEGNDALVDGALTVGDEVVVAGHRAVVLGAHVEVRR